MDSAEIRSRFLRFYTDARARGGAVGLVAPRRPDPAVRQRRHGAVQALLPRRGAAALAACHVGAEVRAHPRHRRGRQDHPPRVVLPDGGQLQLRRLLQGWRDPVRVGAAHQLRRPTAASASPSPSCGRPSTTSDDEAFEIWNKVVGLPADRIQRRDAKDNYWSMGVPGPGGPCSEIYYDRGPEHGIEGGPGRRRGPLPRGLEPRLHAARALRRTVEDRLRHQGRPAGEEHRHRHGSRADGRAAAGRREHLRDRHHPAHPRPRERAVRARSTAPTTTTTCACAWSPTTPAPSRSSSRTASSRATRVAATCCVASCAASYATCGCSAPATR